MKKRMLVLNVEVSGMNKYLFSELEKKGWELTVVDIPFPKVCRWWGLVSTFRPDISQWKKKFDGKMGKLHKTPWTFRQRTKYCQKIIKRRGGQFDLIFQISGMFAPYLDYAKAKTPHVTYNDYTVMLSYTMALCNIYSDWAPYPSKMKKWLDLERDLYKNAKKIFTTNKNARLSLINDYGVEEEKVVRVGYGAPVEEITDIQKNYDGKTVLFVGMDFERKGGYTLLEAFKNVKKVIPEAKLLIVGPDKDIVKIEQDGVEILGCIRDKKRMKELYEQASIFAMPSLCEPFGLVFLEAMAHKLPCIGTTIDAMPEFIKNGKNGYVVPPKDPDTLAEKIISLLCNPDKMKNMGEEAHRCVKEDFKWDNVVENMDLHLEEVLKRK